MFRLLRKNALFFGIVLSFVGLVVIYLLVFGRNLFYTQSYHVLAKTLTPAFNLWALQPGLAFPLMLVLLVLFPKIMLQGLEGLHGRPRVRLWVGGIGLIVTAAVSLAVVIGRAFEHSWADALTTDLNRYLPLLLLGAMGLTALGVAVHPAGLIVGLKRTGWMTRVSALVAALVLVAMFATALELDMAKPVTQEVFSETASLGSQIPPTHSVSIILKEYPRRVSTGESVPLELLFRLTPYDSLETAKRYPIALDTSTSYSVSASLKALGFDLAEPDEHVLNPRKVVIGQRYAWTWLVSAKEEAAGATQSLIANVYLHESGTDRMVFEAPVTTLSVTVGTLLGLPRWLISPQIGLGAILGGLVLIVLPWVLQRVPEKKNATLIIPE